MFDDAPYGPSIVDGRLFFKLLDGSSILCTCIREPYASQIVEACKSPHRSQMARVFAESKNMIEEYDRREAAGEDVSGDVRPRMPGGSDW